MDDAEWVLVGLAFLCGAAVGAWLVWKAFSQPASSPNPQNTYRARARNVFSQPASSPNPQNTYRARARNVEEWALKRDASGRITSVDIYMRAEKTE